MEATERRTRSLGWYLRHPFATRWTRVPILFIAVLGVTVIGSLALRSNWVECRTVQEWFTQTCPTLPRRLLITRTVAILGVGAMILGPVINSLYRLFRYGQPWEGSRVETAVSNIPIVAGFAYLVIALAIAFL